MALEFDPERIKELAGYLADPTNSQCFFTSQSFKVADLPLKEKWYNIDFKREKYSEDLLN